MPNVVSQLIVELVDRVTASARKVSASIRGITKTVRDASGTRIGFSDNLDAAIARNNRALASARGNLVGAVAGFYALKNAIVAPIEAAADFESAMADVKKVVDFSTPKAFSDFKRDVLEMSTRLPMAARDLSAIVAAAGQSGIARDELMKFTEMAAKVGVAFDLPAQQVGESLAKLKTALGLTIDQTQSLADAMNYLSNNQASTAANILDVVRRVGAQAKIYGFTAEQTSAFASAMLAAGAESEVAATSFRNLGRSLTMGAAATKAQRTAFHALGLDAKQVAEDMQRDAVGTVVKVLDKLSQIPKAQQSAISSQLFGNEARALGPLLTNLDLLKTTLGLVDEQQKYAGSSAQEYANRAGTFTNNLQLFKNRINELAVSIGNTLMPALTTLMARIGPLVSRVADFASRFPEATAAIIALAAGFTALKVATTGLSFMGRMAWGGILTAARVLTSIGPAIGAVAAVGAGPILAVAAALAALGAALIWIKNNWEGIQSFFAGFTEGFSSALGPVPEIISPVTGAIRDLWNWINNLLGPINATKEEWHGWGQAAGEAVGSFIRGVIDLPGRIKAFTIEAVAAIKGAAIEWGNAGVELVTALWDGMKQVFDNLIQWVKEKAASLTAPISGIANTVKGWFGGGTPAAAAAGASIDGKRAGGGGIFPGRRYLVGEEGPELITPTRSGYVHPTGSTGSSGPITVAPVFNMAFHGSGLDPETIADKVRAVLREEVREVFRGVFSDTGMRFA